MKRLAHTLLMCLVLGLSPRAAQAFSDPYLFPELTEAGGGGGRFFTGSPVDGYSCAVCHSGGPKPRVEVRGLPELYVPGMAYDVEITWADASASHALNLEIVDTDGASAGDVELLPADQVGASGRCKQSLEEDVAAYLVERGPRRIVGVSNCGAASVRFRFTPRAVPHVAFAASVLRSDGSESPEGDGVLELRRVLHQQGQPDNLVGSTSCSAQPSTSSRAAPLAMVMLLGLVWRVRRRRR